jgi:hypothetical protein
MFDALIGNRNRNVNPNVLRDGAGNLILIDHTRAFGLTTEVPPLSRIEKASWDRALALTRKEFDSKLGSWLDEKQITAILERREKMKTEIDRLIAEKGEAAVMLR